jgi:hypothetical protein
MERVAERKWTQRSWRGSPADLSALVSGVADLGNGASSKPGDARITMSEDGEDIRFDGLDEFVKFTKSGDARLRRIERLTVGVGVLTGEVELVMGLRRRGVFAKAGWGSVTGSSVVAVNGLADGAERLMQKGKRSVNTLVVGAVLAGIALILSGASWLVPDPTGKMMAGVSSAFLVGVVYFWYVDPYLIPNFEVIDPDAPETGPARLRRLLAGSGKWVLTALAGAVIYAVVQKLIEG